MCFFFNDTATTEIYTLSLHDALPIFAQVPGDAAAADDRAREAPAEAIVQGDCSDIDIALLEDAVADHERIEIVQHLQEDRKSTRLNSSHANISHAVFCLKKKNVDTNL